MSSIGGTSGTDSLAGGEFNDVIFGFGADDILDGAAGNDQVFGGAGNDAINGNGAADALFGGAGDDTLYADADDRTLIGGSGNDTILYGSGSDIILGQFRADGAQMHFGSGNDVFSVTLQGTYGDALNLSDLDGTDGTRFDGAAGGDHSGYAIAAAGDVNGDGFDDFVIGAPDADGATGRAYLVFGNGLGLPAAMDLGAPDPNVVVLTGEGQVGFALSSAGDINGDGLSDLLIAANNAGGPVDGLHPGQVHVLFGKATGWTDGSGATIPIDLTSLDGSQGFMLHNDATTADQFGFAVSAAGDLNSDGRGDIVISAPDAVNYEGRTYIVYGQTSAWAASNSVEGAAAVAHVTLTGANVGALARADDVDGDGHADLLLGAFNNGVGGLAYVLFGDPAMAATVDLQQVAVNHTGLEIAGLSAGDQLGFSVAGAGDVNGDGFADIMIGARYALGTAGAAYVVFGKASGWEDGSGHWRVDLSQLDGSNGFVIEGVNAGDRFGSAVSSAGDINGDGFGDLIVGAPGVTGDDGALNAGIGYILLGHGGTWDASVSAGSVDGVTDFRVDAVGGDGLGLRATSAGDVNADGLSDILVSGVDADDSAGVTYLVYGSRQIGKGAAGAPMVVYGEDGHDTISGFDSGDTLYGGVGNDWLDGGAGLDTVFGGDGNDAAWWDSGDTSALFGGAGNDTLLFRGTEAPISVVLAAQEFERALGIQTDTGGNAWSTLESGYDLEWRLATINQINDDGTRVLTTYDPAAANYWSRVTDNYDTGGHYVSSFVDHDDLTHHRTFLDWGASQYWSSYVDNYDAANHRLSSFVNHDDGAYHRTYFDWASSGYWSSYVDNYDAAHHRLSSFVTHDSGVYHRTYFDWAGTQYWSSYVDNYDAANHRLSSFVNHDDGTYHRTYFDWAGSQYWSNYVDNFNTTNGRESSFVNHDDGTYHRTYFDVNATQIWTNYTDYFTAAGVAYQQTGLNDDGSTWNNPL